MAIYSHETEMPLGKHKGKALKDVPAKYLLYIVDELRRDEWRDLQWYVRENLGALMDRANHETVKNMLND